MNNLKEREINLHNLGLAITFESWEAWEKRKIDKLFAIFAMMNLFQKEFGMNQYLYTDLYKKWNSAILVKNNRIYYDITMSKNKADKFTYDDFKHRSPVKVKDLNSFSNDDLTKIVEDLKSLYYVLSQKYVS